MKKYERMYIGKGKANKHLPEVVTVSIAMEKAADFLFEFEGKQYLRFEVAPRLTTDNFGNTHSVYVLQRSNDMLPIETGDDFPDFGNSKAADQEANENAQAKPKRRRKKQTA